MRHPGGQSSGSRARPNLGRSRLPLAAVALALFAAGLFFGIQLAKPPPRPDFGPAEPRTPLPVAEPGVTPAAEEEPTPGRQPAPGGDQARIAIVVDDLGRSLQDLDRLTGLGVPLTYAVLPFETLTPEVVARLRQRGEEFICHLPMQAKGGADPGPGALLGAMSRTQLVEATRRALDAVPGAVGVNNHMGSLIASRPDAMAAVISVVADHRLYFLDSRTSADTVGYELARKAGLAAGERQVFLDTDRDPERIRGQFEQLLALAEERGGVIAIAHPYPETLAILEVQIPRALARGFRFVPASALLDG